MWAWITLFVVEVIGAIWIWRFISKNRDVESEKNAQISQLEFVKDSLEKRIVEEELKLSSKQEIIGQMGENIRFLQKQMGEMGQEIVFSLLL